MTFGVQCHIQRRLFAVSDAEEAQHVPVKSVPWLNNNHCGWVSSSLVHPVRLPQFNYPSNSIQFYSILFYSVESNWIPPESVPMIRCSLATRRRWAKATFPSCVTSHRINVIGVPLLTQQQRNPTTAPDTSCVFSLSLSLLSSTICTNLVSFSFHFLLRVIIRLGAHLGYCTHSALSISSGIVFHQLCVPPFQTESNGFSPVPISSIEVSHVSKCPRSNDQWKETRFISCYFQRWLLWCVR